ncbi:unnamed protein product [Cyclocybe aegerita]|uniref:Uncharacterized protein n=1 Tax=Cyclocybe aegerita TaxID=1973307 RepID=A0A8S0Y005_CYCAE|nr:unnamed protein product [Cyclocybe aegerita]
MVLIVRYPPSEAPREPSGRPPSSAYLEAHGTSRETMHSAADVLWGTQPVPSLPMGYLTKLERGIPYINIEFNFFRRHFETLLVRNAAWAALCARGYVYGKLMAKTTEERLSFLDVD